jgi:hypothetical protein
MKLTHSVLNPKFGMSVIFTANYSFNGRRHPVDSDALLMTNFVNLKIKLAHSFRVAHRNRMCMHVFIVVSADKKYKHANKKIE